MDQASHLRDDASPFTVMNRTASIFLVSVFGLFLEMMLIRWIGTEIRIFAYLQNTVLIVCFMGLGIGCFTSKRPIRLWHSFAAIAVLTAILAIPFTYESFSRITTYLSMLNGFLIWENAIAADKWSEFVNVSRGLIMTFILLALLWEIFLPWGRLLGRLMDEHTDTVKAYSSNVAGSLAGIWLYVALCAVSTPPVIWVLAAAMLAFAFCGRGTGRLVNFSLLATSVFFAWIAGLDGDALETRWSPYQKLVMTEVPPDGPTAWQGKYLITVNNAGYQGIADLSEETVRANSRIPAAERGLSQYDVPLRLKPNPRRVLIVGAGSGNDVAGALRGGAHSVTAVDIDPEIIRMGRNHHPEGPYDSDRVRVVNDDARSFFATTQERYDLIIFGLLDSHTTTSMTNARLDHYVYTRESLERARGLLTEDGVMSLTFMSHAPYISDRMGSCVREVFGAEPLVFQRPTSHLGWGGVMFIAGNQDVIRTSLESDPILAESIAGWQTAKPIRITGETQIATDDWPYIYLESPSIPMLHCVLGLLVFSLLIWSRLRTGVALRPAGWDRSHWHFFFMGAAFLLLEVQNISKASVVLGNTWLVNAVIVSGIMVMILAANVIATRWRKLPLAVPAVGLIASCIALYFVDLSTFGFLPYVTKAVLVGALTTLPMLFSGIIFIRSFAVVKRRDVALGANLIGALVGGMLQSVTFVIGIKALLLLVAGLYVMALLTGPRAESCESDDEGLNQSDREMESDKARTMAVSEEELQELTDALQPAVVSSP